MQVQTRISSVSGSADMRQRMKFLRTAFWVALALIVVVFSFTNWPQVTVNLWDGLRMDTKLPVLIIGAFLLGSLPLWLYHRAMSWRWRRRFDTVERTLADNRAVTASTETTHTPPKSSSISTTTPPGVV